MNPNYWRGKGATSSSMPKIVPLWLEESEFALWRKKKLVGGSSGSSLMAMRQEPGEDQAQVPQDLAAETVMLGSGPSLA